MAVMITTVTRVAGSSHPIINKCGIRKEMVNPLRIPLTRKEVMLNKYYNFSAGRLFQEC
jgi:hypothetical protein